MNWTKHWLPGTATWWISSKYDVVLDSRSLAPWLENIAPSTKPEILIASQRRQRETEPWPHSQATCKKWCDVRPRIMRVDRQTDRQTNKRGNCREHTSPPVCNSRWVLDGRYSRAEFGWKLFLVYSITAWAFTWRVINMVITWNGENVTSSCQPHTHRDAASVGPSHGYRQRRAQTNNRVKFDHVYFEFRERTDNSTQQEMMDSGVQHL